MTQIAWHIVSHDNDHGGDDADDLHIMALIE